MARFSLSPPAKTAPSTASPIELQWKFPPRDYEAETFDTADDSSIESSSDDSSTTSSSDSSEEEEPPHPLGFESYGRTRFGLSPSSFTVRCVDENAWNAPVRISRNHISQHQRGLDHHGIQSSTLLRGITDTKVHDDGGMDRIENLLKAASLNNIQPTPLCVPRSDDSKLMQLARAAEQQQSQITLQMNQRHKEQADSHQAAVEALMSLIKADQASYTAARQRVDERQRQIDKQIEDQRKLEQLQHEEEERQKAEEERVKQAELEKVTLEKEAREEALRVEREQIQKAEESAAEEERQRTAYISDAKGLVSQLNHQIRPQLAQFDKEKSVAKRRLGFKKIVNGKINTLSHDETKIKEVASLVVEAITNATREDEAATDSVSKLGKQYLLDLLASNLIVRVQADGFNGTRGDGFPLGAAFALISTQCEELHGMLEGHIYRVCPTAVPVLEMTYDEDAGGTEEERWMESLGMVREKSGEFESFDKFLHRTEGLISIMANIMASLPSNHKLLGGHQGALIWLERFLDLLPSPPTKPLPLLTAPVLVAFLTGAGPMLANKFESQFRPLFASIERDVLDRLDDSPVGVPSATRLKKVMEGGFDTMKKNMPAGAIESLYDGKEGSGNASTTLPPAPAQTKTSNPFGQSAVSVASPFGAAAPSSASPFGQSPAPASAGFGQAAPNTATPFGASPFGQQAPTSTGFGGASTPFGASAPAPAFGGATPAPSPFGSTQASASSGGFGQSTPFGSSTAAPSPFGGSAPAQSPFGSSAPAPSPFGAAPVSQSNNPFGQQASTNQASSGGFGQSTPFGSSTAAPSPFGGSAPAPTPFGSSAPAPSPFGAAPASQGNPFGGAGTSSFGSNSSGNVKKDTRAPCKFHARGSCRYGANCKFSHGDGAPTGNTSSFSSFGSSFGAGGGSGGFGSSNSTNPSPFGGSSSGFGNPSPFSSNPSSNPFGGPRR